MLTYKWRSCGQDDVRMVSQFSFFILQADLWIPVHSTDSNDNVALINSMYDMIQFVVVVSVPNKASKTFVDHFMQHVLLKFGIYYLVILDDDSPFKGVFSAMFKALNINFDILAKINYKGLLVGKIIGLATNLSRLQQKLEERMMFLLLMALQKDIHEIVLQQIGSIYFVVFLPLGKNIVSPLILI